MENSSDDERVEARDEEEVAEYSGSGAYDASSAQEEEEEADLHALLEARARAAAQRQALRGERPQKVFANDVDALESKRQEIALRIKGVPEPIPFIETLAVTSAVPLRVADADDDLEREKTFYTMAIANLGQAQAKLGGSIPFKRPEDYFAPMLKNDEHMTRVRALLLKEKQRGEEAAMRRKARESARFQKQVASERAQQRDKAKQAELEAIKKWRALNKRSADDQDFPAELLDPNSELRKQLDATGELVSRKRKQSDGESDEGSARKKGPSKAALKAKKYGFGGKRGKHAKNPNAQSFAEGDKEWNARRNRTISPEFRKYGQQGTKSGKKSKSGAARPGKRQRQVQGGRPPKRPRRE